MELTLERWDAITPADREAMARRLAKELPTGFTFDGLRPHSCGEQRHDVAFYRKDDMLFALVPGGQVTLGYDANRAWEPNRAESESWEYSVGYFGWDMTIHEYIAEVTLRIRRVELAPLLVETRAGELGWEPISLDDPDVKYILSRGGIPGTVVETGGPARTRVRLPGFGAAFAERSFSPTHTELVAQLQAAGFRLPGSDEWEYACGCGAPTLFRWGDHAAGDQYPAYPGQNAFGLSIVTDTYERELVSETGISRGGDGGGVVHGGCGDFVGWLRLATAYFEEGCCTYEAAGSATDEGRLGRRVLELR